jgi:hypothetical protein
MADSLVISDEYRIAIVAQRRENGGISLRRATASDCC